jgi:hypothetical protein
MSDRKELWLAFTSIIVGTGLAMWSVLQLLSMPL